MDLHRRHVFGLDENQQPRWRIAERLDAPRARCVRDTGGRVASPSSLQEAVIAAINGRRWELAHHYLAAGTSARVREGAHRFLFGAWAWARACSSGFCRASSHQPGLELTTPPSLRRAEALVAGCHGGFETSACSRGQAIARASPASARRWASHKTRQMRYPQQRKAAPARGHSVDSLAMFDASSETERGGKLHDKRPARFTHAFGDAAVLQWWSEMT